MAIENLDHLKDADLSKISRLVLLERDRPTLGRFEMKTLRMLPLDSGVSNQEFIEIPGALDEATLIAASALIRDNPTAGASLAHVSQHSWDTWNFVASRY